MGQTGRDRRRRRRPHLPAEHHRRGARRGAGGGIWGKIRDKGFKDEDLKAVGESLPPGSSAIVAIAEDRVVERLERGLEGYERIARHAVSADAAALIVAEADAPPDEDQTGTEANPAGT